MLLASRLFECGCRKEETEKTSCHEAIAPGTQVDLHPGLRPGCALARVTRAVTNIDWHTKVNISVSVELGLEPRMVIDHAFAAWETKERCLMRIAMSMPCLP